MSEAELLHQVKESNHTITVWEQENLRWIEFGDGLIQSAMDLDRPDYLPEAFSRAMLAGTMFQSNMPKKVLLAGTGGGATARYLANRFPDIEGDAVELSATVINLAKRYFDFPQHHWTIHHADIRDYLQQCEQRYDIIVFDIADGQSVPIWLQDPDFLADCRRCLSSQGHISINLIAETGEHFKANLAAIRQAFDQQTVCLSLQEHRNIILFGFNHQNVITAFDEDDLLTLQRRWQIEFKTFYQQMQQDNPKNSGFL